MCTQAFGRSRFLTLRPGALRRRSKIGGAEPPPWGPFPAPPDDSTWVSTPGHPAEQISDPITAITTGLPLNLAFATKGELAIDLLKDAYTDGVRLDFVAGDEVYGACTKLRAFLQEQNQAYVLRVRATFTLTLGGGTCLTGEQVMTKHLKQKRKWTLRSAGAGSKGKRTYAWAWIATASPTHFLLIRKHHRTGDLAFHYCFVPAGQPVTLPRLISAAGLRWPVEESFEFGKDLFGLDQSQVRLYEAIRRHTVLVMAALAICAASAAAARHRTDTQAPPPTRADQPSPENPGMIPLTVAEIKCLVNAATIRTPSLEHTAHWSVWRRRHQARARWFHRRARLATEYAQLS
ncbi:transposase [Streptosporangium subroseum]|uniref:transposase n=1 Tax=Streptosporangium subroseum TaxID=106412 RepID=UPI00342499D7